MSRSASFQRAESDSFVSVTVDVSLAAGQQKEINLQFRQLVSVLQAIQSAAVFCSRRRRRSWRAYRAVLPDRQLPFTNNLPANAHGNGYSDPNVLIPPVIEGVTVDGAAFNVREGNHSIDLAATYVPRQRFNDFVQLTRDYRDFDLMAGWSPENPKTNAWIAGEVSFGNGFLDRLEHRQQYKLNGQREFKLGDNQLTLFGIGYYGFSYVPGLIPIEVPVPGDTIDPRQSDTTHNILLVVTDNWKLSEQRQFSLSGFFRNYALQLRSNFGDGLIQQSEARNVMGGEATYIQSVRPWISLLAGVDIRRTPPAIWT